MSMFLYISQMWADYAWDHRGLGYPTRVRVRPARCGSVSYTKWYYPKLRRQLLELLNEKFIFQIPYLQARTLVAGSSRAVHTPPGVP